MTIQGTGMIYSLQQNGFFSSTNLAIQNKNSEQQGGPQGVGKPGGQGGKGGPPPMELDLDTDADGLWSETEIDDFSAAMGLNLDASQIISMYDTDGDGGINSGEREALRVDNALNLPRPEQLMQMRSEFMGTQETESQMSQDIFGEALQAYLSSAKYQEEIVSILDVTL